MVSRLVESFALAARAKDSCDPQRRTRLLGKDLRSINLCLNLENYRSGWETTWYEADFMEANR